VARAALGEAHEHVDAPLDQFVAGLEVPFGFTAQLLDPFFENDDLAQVHGEADIEVLGERPAELVRQHLCMGRVRILAQGLGEIAGGHEDIPARAEFPAAEILHRRITFFHQQSHPRGDSTEHPVGGLGVPLPCLPEALRQFRSMFLDELSEFLTFFGGEAFEARPALVLAAEAHSLAPHPTAMAIAGLAAGGQKDVGTNLDGRIAYMEALESRFQPLLHLACLGKAMFQPHAQHLAVVRGIGMNHGALYANQNQGNG
jgi:hypothetical protein